MNSDEIATTSESPIEVGLRLGSDGQLGFFGIEKVNEVLSQGGAVARIDPGRAIMVKSGESDEAVRLRLMGFSVSVVVVEDRRSLERANPGL